MTRHHDETSYTVKYLPRIRQNIKCGLYPHPLPSALVQNKGPVIGGKHIVKAARFILRQPQFISMRLPPDGTQGLPGITTHLQKTGGVIRWEVWARLVMNSQVHRPEPSKQSHLPIDHKALRSQKPKVFQQSDPRPRFRMSGQTCCEDFFILQLCRCMHMRIGCSNEMKQGKDAIISIFTSEHNPHLPHSLGNI